MHLNHEINLFFVPRLQNTTKEAFVVDAIQLTHQHRQLFTHHHVVEVVEAITTYRRNMGIVSDSSSNESAH
jgi:hypothetical protein